MHLLIYFEMHVCPPSCINSASVYYLYHRQFWRFVMSIIWGLMWSNNWVNFNQRWNICRRNICIRVSTVQHGFSLQLSLSFSGPPADHWALVSGLPTYVAENGFVSFSGCCRTIELPETLELDKNDNKGELTYVTGRETYHITKAIT